MDLLKWNNVEDAWLGIENIADIEYTDLFYHGNNEFWKEFPHLHAVELLRDPAFVAYAAWVLLEVRLLPFQAVCIAELWKRPFPIFMATRGGSKTWTMALYCMLRALFMPSYKIVVVGSAFRQSRLLFDYCDKFWINAPVYRSMCSANSGPRFGIDRCVFTINDSTITAIPVGNGGQKIRGLRANCIVADEFDAQDKEIFETVVAGFGAVSHSPSENVVKEMRNIKMREMNLEVPDDKAQSNQIIISGTAGYYFGPLYEYYKKYEKIILSQGNQKELEDVFKGDVPPSFNWRDYSIIRIPYDALPNGFLDEKTISRAKATMNRAIFDMEYSACFVEDSDGFFKRSLIESCVASDKNINGQNWVSWCPTTFEPQMEGGGKKRRYVYGIDPASQQDNLAICILDVCDDHARIVHMWTTNNEDFRARQMKGLTTESSYNGFVARKIRNLMKTFPPVTIGIDVQGGGYALMEVLHDLNMLEPGDDCIWNIIDPDKPSEHDRYPGLHIIQPIQFIHYEWLHGANFGMSKDFETRRLLFPRFDTVSIEMALAQDSVVADAFQKKHGKPLVFADTLEDLYVEIEELKNELAAIVVSSAGTGVAGKLRWSVPESISIGNKKIKSRKDRYSALLIANSIARELYSKKHEAVSVYNINGGLVQEFKTRSSSMYTAPEWFKAAW